MSAGLADIHQHLLWGLDDGPAAREGTQRMLREAHAQGISRVAATPHAFPGFVPFDMGLYRERLAEAQDFCRAEGLQVQLLSGAEIAWSYQAAAALRQRALPTLGDTDYVLIELGRDVSIQQARDAVQQLTRAGYCPILAHAERCRCFSWFPYQALRFREQTGALMQINAQTLLKPHSLAERRFVRVMLSRHGADLIATDAHGTPLRPINLRPARDWLAQHTDADYARALTTFSGDFS